MVKLEGENEKTNLIETKLNKRTNEIEKLNEQKRNKGWHPYSVLSSITSKIIYKIKKNNKLSNIKKVIKSV